MMKERFAKLLLGEDMSGSGKGVCTALAISNAITNLCGMLSLLHTYSNWETVYFVQVGKCFKIQIAFFVFFFGL